jgi:hypothetical protein
MADSKTPTPGEITIMAAGAVALIASFLDFYKVPSAYSGAASSQSMWSKYLFPVATLMAIFVFVMGLQIALTKFANVSLPARVAGFTWVQIHLVLGFYATVYAIAYLIVDKGGYDFGIGYYLMLLAAIAALVGAVLLQRERAAAPPPPPA